MAAFPCASPSNQVFRYSVNSLLSTVIRNTWSLQICSGSWKNVLLRFRGSKIPSACSCFVPRRYIALLATFKVLDNSSLGQRSKRGRKPYLIGFYNQRKTAGIGDVIKVAVAGKTNKAVIIGSRTTKHHTVPRYDNNCIVLVDDNLAPLGTRIKGPVPTIMRRRQNKYSKLLALAPRFI